ncbi:uncharacterized protein TEOVI_000046400 [Trypanosoma equiperdum]|uniref:Uncharacterized protein n=4 Tax=Trypanozoon TaxID=39700 RepID=Q38FW6_TRYB2|nr:hypothetical protein, conserved [Trypanosoma brucei gambiense DAL972]XP_803502.1 hypothetical protein, conserved [Trypanosoma brucei brucei TREU927]RHW67335.1 hypothetical protein DPX39_000020400 [Trypanosoma brucei equiperdum]SCU67504.1 hypothetical protein, conserved [Trypanosoma equiperdum]EAN76304.1 hypothetical protein, conserved [Trypanosoma brucei brucei TREU927]CBH13979.1 hypothetical protein, conserved [Trypanosoma brucei gambiense DAL972]|eukprot:XP_011776253.1 hypothetical protein, conserved [Trypanosoma brucei gambiense DAL972]
MPNPYTGNYEAARFVEYYASAQMLRDSVHRLHTVSIQRHMDALRRAESAHQKHTCPAAPIRSRQQIEEHANRMVYQEMLRRQKNMTKLAWDVYKPVPPKRLSSEELRSLVKRMYEQQMQNMTERKKEARQRQVVLSDEVLAETRRGRRMLRQRDIHRSLESGWRTPSSRAKYNDGKLLLVSGGNVKSTSKERPPDLGYLARLAKPLRPTERVNKC